jgi:hypothetical protein
MFSKVMRQGHMYVGMFLTPWFLMYALGTIPLNHWGLMTRIYGEDMGKFSVEREVRYTRVFPPDAKPKAIGLQILRDLDMDGGHNVRQGEDGEIIVDRQNPISPRRITYYPGQKKLVIEKQAFNTMGFFTRSHTHVGYSESYRIHDAWGASVDLSILATFFWIFSGFWLWWELKKTRRLGAILTLVGVAVFAMFVIAS